MSALSEAVQKSQTFKGPRCTMGLLIGKLDGETLDDLNALLTSEVTSVVIADGLTEIGYWIQPGRVQRHRKGRCLCGLTR